MAGLHLFSYGIQASLLYPDKLECPLPDNYRPGFFKLLTQSGVVDNRFTKLRVRNFAMDTVAVFVFDTDIETNLDILRFNVDFLGKQKCIKEVICIPQVKNLEDELLRAC